MTSKELSTERLDRLHDVLSGYVARDEVPRIVAAVSRRGETHVEALGAARDMLFPISSMTKPMVAVAAMILLEEGRLRLDDPVDDLLPELANRRVLRRPHGPLDDTVPAHRPISLRDLLTFTPGIGLVLGTTESHPIVAAMFEAGFVPMQPAPEPDEWMRRLGALPLVYQPGEKWMYHWSADILGVLIARAAGQRLDAFMRERLFAPLGMGDTDFCVPSDKADRFATSLMTNPETGARVPYDPYNGRWDDAPAFLSGGGGLVSTVDDCLAFGEMMLRGGAPVLSRPTVEAMTTDQLTDAQKDGAALIPGYFDTHGWGFGMSVVTRRSDGAHPVGKYGWDGGLGSSWYCDPSESMITVILTNVAFTAAFPPPVIRDFWTLAYAAVND